MKQWILATLLFVSSAANAAVVAVVDSGVDFAHEELQPLMYQNPNEIPGNHIDDDGNGLGLGGHFGRRGSIHYGQVECINDDIASGGVDLTVSHRCLGL